MGEMMKLEPRLLPLFVCFSYISTFPAIYDRFVCFVLFVALHLKSTAMVIAGRAVHLTTLFPGQA